MGNPHIPSRKYTAMNDYDSSRLILRLFPKDGTVIDLRSYPNENAALETFRYEVKIIDNNGKTFTVRANYLLINLLTDALDLFEYGDVEFKLTSSADDVDKINFRTTAEDDVIVMLNAEQLSKPVSAIISKEEYINAIESLVKEFKSRVRLANNYERGIYDDVKYVLDRVRARNNKNSQI